MKVKISNVANWMGRLLLMVSLMAVMSGMAAAATVGGTVTNSSTKAGRIYLLVLQQMGGSISSGVSVGPLAPGNSTSYTINGVPDGNYFMFAILDTLGAGIPHANDPAGMSSNFTVSGGSVSGVNLTMYDAAPPTLSKMGAPQVMPSASGVMVEFDKPSNDYGILLADSYNVYWSTGSTPGSSAGGGMKNIIANDHGPLFLSSSSIAPGDDYFFSVAPVVNGVEITSALSDVSEKTRIADQTGGTSLSGTVNLSAVSDSLSSSTPLFVVAVDESKGAIITANSAPSANQTYTISGVQPGFYKIYVILDRNNSGTYDFSTLQNRTNDKSQAVILVPPNAPVSMTVADVTLVPKNAMVNVSTTHTRSSGIDSYSLQFYIESVNRQVVNVRIGSGPQLSGPIDLSSSSSGSFEYWTQVPARPAVADRYPVTVYYAHQDGFPDSEVINADVTAVLDNFATAAYPPPNSTVPSGQFSNYAWRPPSINGYFTYRASIDNNGGGGGGDSKDLPFYSLSGKNQTYLNDGSYTWNLSVQDDYGNQALLKTFFSASSPATPPSISGFTLSGKVGDEITIDGGGFDSTLSNNNVSFNNAASAPATFVNGTGTQIKVKVPSGAVSGPIGVIVNNSVAAVSDGEFTVHISFSGTVQNKTGSAFTAGATISMVENPAVSTTSSLTDGTYNLSNTLNPGIPAARPYSLKITSSGYLEIYTQIMTNGGTVTGSNYAMLAASDLSGFGATLATGKGVIRTRVQTMDSGSPANLAGATVTATSKMHPDVPYTVKYTDGSGNISSGNSTAVDGMFYVLDVDEGDYVSVTASKAGMAFNTRVFVTHGNAVHQGSIRGASTATSTASLPSGNYSGMQVVALSLVPPATLTNFDIIYTTSGSDPSQGGLTYNPANPIYITSTTTLKFLARNRAQGAGFAVESPYNTRVYNFDATITGKVTDANGGAPITNIPVQLYSTGGSFLRSTNTDSNGNYSLGGMNTGSYKVCFFSGASSYIPQCYDNKPDSASADPIAVTAPNTKPNINASLVQGGIITGHVTNSGNNGIQGVSVQLRDINGGWIPNINGTGTDQNGNYTLGGIPSGTYKLYFDGTSGGYIGKWYNNANTFDITAGSTNPGFDAQLVHGATITGRVTSNGSTGIQNVQVQLHDINDNWVPNMNAPMTDQNGNYSLGGIPGGTYKLYFDGQSTGYISQWYNGGGTFLVAAGSTTPGFNAQLTLGATITGRVTSNGISGIQNVMVQLRDSSGNSIPNMNPLMTDQNGNFSLSGLPGGTYKLYFDGQSTGYISQWYNGGGTFLVAAGSTTPGFDAQLVPGASISGTVTNGTSGIQDISVQLYNSSGMQTLFNANTSPSGSYQFNGLQAGTYKVCFSPGQTNYIAKCYNNQAYDSIAATGITITVPGGRNDINAAMALGGGISGQVTNGSSGIQNISVEVRDTTNGNSIPGVFGMWTDFNGNYNIHGVPTGHIKVYFNPNGSGYAGQWYNNKASFANSDSVPIFAGMTAGPVNAVLQTATVPGAPTITSITPGNGQATVYFTPPASDGGLQIQDYSITANPGGFTGFGLGSPITINSLPNNRQYTITVTARNNLGSGPAGSVSYYAPLHVNTFSDLQTAVDAVSPNGVMWAQSGVGSLPIAPLWITKGISILGGYSPDYSSVNGYTTIPGRVNIQGNNFKVIFKNVIVKAP